MGRIDERISEQFAAWEQRGRGWRVWPEPVAPEPAFEEFPGYRLTRPAPVVDDGRRPGLLASLFDSIQEGLAPKLPVIVEEVSEPEPEPNEHLLTTEFIASLPAKLDVREDALRALLDSLHGCAGPTAFEWFGKEDGVSLRFASSPHDAPVLLRQLTAFLPEVPFVKTESSFADTWHDTAGVSFIVDFGLANEFMLPLQTEHGIDPFVGLVAVLSELRRDEAAVFQVLFQPARHPWGTSVWRAVTDNEGKMLFSNKIPLIPGTKAKLESPLFGVVLRAAAQAESFERSANIVQNLARALHVFARAENNELIPLTNDEYPFEAHEEDLLHRQSRRSGMLLNREELLGFVHLPGDEVRSPKLRRQATRTKVAPSSVLSPIGLLLGFNEHAGRHAEVRLNAEQRVRHAHVVGASGMGKSTLLFNLIQQDINNGHGLAVLDPHGDLIETILGSIPPERVDDVVLLDPADEAFSVGFNILSAHSEFEKTLLASDLVSVFRRLCSSWGDQMGSVLNNAILAFLESDQGGTLADLRRFLLDAEFRNRFLETVNDPDLVYYWRKGFPQLGGNKSIGPVLTRLETFLSPKPIRYMVSQRANKLDFAHILDSGKIFLAKLAQGQIGKENAFLLGSLLMAKFQQMAMSRQRMEAAQRRDFFIYLDEFQHFITPSMAEVLTGARKYRVGLVLAHQELHQLQRDPEVASAVLSNAGTRIVFRVGDADAHTLEKGFSTFTAKDIQNLETGQAICRIERSAGDFNLSVLLSEEMDPVAAAEMRKRVVTVSREKYATPRAEVAATLFQAMDVAEPEEPKPKPRTHREPDTPKPNPASPLEKTAKPTISGKETTGAPPSIGAAAILPEVMKPPADMIAQSSRFHDAGRGGAQHQAIQRRIKDAAETLGFRGTIEKEVLEGRGSVDLLLERVDRTIACEISITTSIDHEVGNVMKCLKAGLGNVAVICLDEQHREKIRAAATGSLGAEIATRVSFYNPDEFIAHLNTLPPPPIAPEGTKLRRGFKVTRSASSLPVEEQKRREDVAIQSIAAAMQRKDK